jgi:hypothetical protein
MIIEKRRILEALRERGQHTRADWVDRQLPDRVDTDYNAGILATLNLRPADLADPADVPGTGIDPDSASNS